MKIKGLGLSSPFIVSLFVDKEVVFTDTILIGKNMLNRMMILIVTLLFSFPTVAFAHGVKGNFYFPTNSVLVLAEYDDGEPMAYSKVEIKRANATQPYQIGFTDYKGRFLFLPDKKGLWIATVKDGMGHMLRLTIPFNNNIMSEKKVSKKVGNISSSASKAVKFEKIWWGFSIIFFMFGLFFWVKAIGELKKR